MPWGGSVVLAMVPIILYAVRWGLGSGLIAGFAFGVLQFMFDGGFAIGWESIVGDYLLAFTVLGLAGLMKGKKLGVFWGTLIGGVGRFLVHYVVGATIWAAYMPEEFFGLTMTTPWFYSLLYNIAYMGPNIIITLVIFALLYKPMKKYLLGQDIQAA
jgi:thiamine transporter